MCYPSVGRQLASFNHWQMMCSRLSCTNIYDNWFINDRYNVLCTVNKAQFSLTYCDVLAITTRSRYTISDINHKWSVLTYWDLVAHICVSELGHHSLNNGFSLAQRKAFTWTNADLLLIGPQWIYFNDSWMEIQEFSLNELHLKMAAILFRSQCVKDDYTPH